MFQQRFDTPELDSYMAGGRGMRLSQLMAGRPMTGGNHPAMPSPMTGGQMQGGYDSSGINPGGIYTGGQTGNFPANPGGFAPMGGQFPPQPMTGGPQSSYPQGLAAMFRGFSPYRFG